LNTATAEILQNAAELVVLDSLDVWNLRPISEHTQAEFNSSNVLNTYSFGNSSTKANQYFWDFGDGNTSNEVEPSNSYAGAGTYTVTLIASSPCDSDTVSYEVVVDEVSIDEFSIEELKLAHIEDGLYTMNLPKETTEIELYSMEGRKIAFILTGEGRIRLDFKDAGKGVYLLKLKSKNSEKSVRLPY
jgi:PKD repeat protein